MPRPKRIQPRHSAERVGRAWLKEHEITNFIPLYAACGFIAVCDPNDVRRAEPEVSVAAHLTPVVFAGKAAGDPESVLIYFDMGLMPCAARKQVEKAIYSHETQTPTPASPTC